MKKVLITNASSCLGINLASFLLDNTDVTIFACDRNTDRSIPFLYNLLKNDRYNFSEYNSDDLVGVRVDEIYHLSPYLNKDTFLDDKYSYILNEIDFFRRILDIATVMGSKIVFVNNILGSLLQNNAYHSYYNALLTIHGLLMEYAQKEHLDYKIAQISDIYGVNSTPSKNDNLVGYLIVKAFNNEPIDFESDSYFYLTNIKDVVRGLSLVMNCYSSFNKFDICNPNLCLKSDLAKLIINFTKSRSKLTVGPEIPVKPNFTPNTQRINDELQFHPTVQILDGISKTVDFYKLMYFS